MSASFVETNCVFEHQGRKYQSGGAVVTGDFAIAYLSSDGFNAWRGSKVRLTTWHGEFLGLGEVTAVWNTPKSYVSSKMFQVRAKINGVVYSGRTCGQGMIWKGKRLAKQ